MRTLEGGVGVGVDEVAEVVAGDSGEGFVVGPVRSDFVETEGDVVVGHVVGVVEVGLLPLVGTVPRLEFSVELLHVVHLRRQLQIGVVADQHLQFLGGCRGTLRGCFTSLILFTLRMIVPGVFFFISISWLTSFI